MSIRALPRIFISGADMAAPFEIPRAEFDKRRGPNFEYVSIVGDRAPPLNYRN
jgi:aminobenzoyl-glutamate utilization protein B